MMTALLLKDFYTLVKQVKIFLLIIVVFAIIPGYSMAAMAIVYAAMLPMTALAYDERSKWDSLAAMMPYSTRSIVFEKYLLAYIAVVGASTLNFAAQLILSLVRNSGIDVEIPVSFLMTACVAIIMLAINLPIMLRFGVEKGRIAFLVVFGAIGALVTIFSDMLDALSPVTMSGILLAALLVAVIVNVVSIFLSIEWYKRKAV